MVDQTTAVPTEDRVGYDLATVQRWMALDLWMALGRDCEGFFIQCERDSWADMWAELLASVRRKI